MISRCVLSVLVAAAVPLTALAEAPRYQWQPQQKFVYDIEIVADLPDATETLKGRTVYTVKSNGAPLKVDYRGGLTKTSKRKPNASSNSRVRGPFGPAGFAPPPPNFGPFARRVNPFMGLEQTTNQISLTSQGTVLSLKGTSHLPYLLGNLSLLTFESLPDSDQKSWSTESGVLITEKKDQTSRHPFDPFGNDPFFAGRFGGGSNKPEKTTTGSRETSYALLKETGDLVAFKKTFHLTSPGDGVSLEIKGEGTWTFNRKLNVPESLAYRQDLHIKDGNVTLVVPVSIKYRRLSNEEWAKIERERVAALAAAKAEAARKAAEAKAMADAAISGSERADMLAVLKNGDEAALHATLKQLASKTAREDVELATAIRPHLAVGSEATQKLATSALAAFAPEFKRVNDLNRRYRDRNQVSELGLWVAYDTPLPAGLIVAANKYHYEEKYYPAQVVSIASDGLVKVKFLGFGGRHEDRLREDMFLAPPEVEQPNLTPPQLALVSAYQTQVTASLGSDADEAKRVETLNRAYRDTKRPVPKTGSPVPPNVKLPKFTVLAARKDDGKWYQSHVSSELPDGRVAVRFSQDVWDAKLPRERLRFPPPEVKAPNLPPIVLSAGAAQFRTWTDSAGKFTVIAKYVSAKDDQVEIHRQSDGKVFAVPLSRLSPADRQYVEAMLKKPDDNPFDP